jgi:hypothetical protein
MCSRDLVKFIMLFAVVPATISKPKYFLTDWSTGFQYEFCFLEPEEIIIYIRVGTVGVFSSAKTRFGSRRSRASD